MRRAQTYARTWYKGRWVTQTELKKSTLGITFKKFFQRKIPIKHPPADARCLRILSWNAGGVSTDACDELLNELESLPNAQEPQLLQETHWKCNNDFSTKDWRVMCSSFEDKPNTGGLAVLVFSKIAQPDQIRVANPHQGRIMHTRVHFSNCTLDLLNVYQNVYYAGQTQPAKDAQKERGEVWEALQQTMSNIPDRHVCLVGGDFQHPHDVYEWASGIYS